MQLLAEASKKKVELARSSLHTRREAQVLGAQFVSICSEVERLKEAAPSGGGEQEEGLVEVIGGLRELRLDHARNVEVRNAERGRIEEEADGEVAALTEVKREAMKQISTLNQELDEKKSLKREYELQLQAVEVEVERMKVERGEVVAELMEEEGICLKETQTEESREVILKQVETERVDSKKDLEVELAELMKENDAKRNDVKEVQITKVELDNLKVTKAEELTMVTASKKEIEASNDLKAINITSKMEQLSLEQEVAEHLATKTIRMKEQLEGMEKKTSLAQSEIVAVEGVEEQEAKLAGFNNKLSEEIISLEEEARVQEARSVQSSARSSRCQ